MVFIFNPNNLDQREVSESDANRATTEMGWVRVDPANKLVAIHHAGRNDHKMVLEKDLPVWEQKGYYAEPTIVYHPEEGEKLVPSKQAKKMLNSGWYDSPAKFPGNDEGTMPVKKKEQ